jgi:hypothetical protein
MRNTFKGLDEAKFRKHITEDPKLRVIYRVDKKRKLE